MPYVWGKLLGLYHSKEHRDLVITYRSPILNKYEDSTWELVTSSKSGLNPPRHYATWFQYSCWGYRRCILSTGMITSTSTHSTQHFCFTSCCGICYQELKTRVSCQPKPNLSYPLDRGTSPLIRAPLLALCDNSFS